MKKKVFITFLVFILILLCLGAAGFFIMSARGISPNTGIYLASENGSHLIVINDSPIVMSAQNQNEAMFDGLQSGDKILIINGVFLETYPGQTSVYACFKLKNGDISAVSPQVLQSLNELGWEFY